MLCPAVGVATKNDEELAELALIGFDGPTDGIENGYDEAFAFMSKNYGTANITSGSTTGSSL